MSSQALLTVSNNYWQLCHGISASTWHYKITSFCNLKAILNWSCWYHWRCMATAMQNEITLYYTWMNYCIAKTLQKMLNFLEMQSRTWICFISESILWKERLNSKFHEYHQSEQPPLTSSYCTPKWSRHATL